MNCVVIARASRRRTHLETWHLIILRTFHATYHPHGRRWEKIFRYLQLRRRRGDDDSVFPLSVTTIIIIICICCGILFARRRQRRRWKWLMISGRAAHWRCQFSSNPFLSLSVAVHLLRDRCIHVYKLLVPFEKQQESLTDSNWQADVH